MFEQAARYPHYVDGKVAFKHEQSEASLIVSSDWATVELKMRTNHDDTIALYFPGTLDLEYDKELEAQLTADMRQWPFFALLPPKLGQLALHLSHFCSFKTATLSYERRVLLHRHVAWIFLMDDVTEAMPLYGLHDTAGRLYLDNLKTILTGGEAMHDLTCFARDCPQDLLDAAHLAQRIFVEDLMPLKRRLLAAHHLQLCIDILLQFFDFEYDEGRKFCTETSSHDVLQTRAITVGGLLPMALVMTETQAAQCARNNPGMIQASVLMVLMNDIIGLYKDLQAVEQQNDGSAFLNLVRVGIREHNLDEKAALRLYIDKLNKLTWSVEFWQAAYPSESQGWQLECLRLAFNYLDYHLFGIMGKPNNRYGWKVEKIV